MTGDTESVARSLRRIATASGHDQVTIGAREIDDADIATLHAAERAGIASAEHVRAREFASGRALLRELIGRDVAVPVGHDRRPVLPRGVVGSLAHDRDLAVGAIAPRDRYIAIGVDVEPVRVVDDDVAEIIRRPDEGAIDPLLAFCLKEAAYKAWSNSGGGFLEHHDVAVRLDGAEFDAVVLRSGFSLRGGWAYVAGRWLALVVIPAATSPGTARGHG